MRTDLLIDDLWAAGAVDTRRNTLQSKVAKLRRALGDPELIVERRRRVQARRRARTSVDALAVLDHAAAATRLLERGRRARAPADLARLRFQVPGRSSTGAGDGDWVDPHRARLEAARMSLLETEFSARLRLGELGEVIGELEAVVATHPFQESLWELLITALYRAGRQADALAAYQRVRTNWPTSSVSIPDPSSSSSSNRSWPTTRPSGPSRGSPTTLGRTRPGTCRRCPPSSSAATPKWLRCATCSPGSGWSRSSGRAVSGRRRSPSPPAAS